MFELFKWLLTCASLCGVCLNILRNRACFAVWLGTNLSWCAVDLWHGIWSQACLMAVYAGLAVWGWIAWKKT